MENQNYSEIKLDEYYRISQNCMSVINKDIAVIYHKLYGNALRISKECWEIVQNHVPHIWTLQNICDACTDNDDKEYMIHLFKEMIKAKLLIKTEEEEIEDKISQIDLAITNGCNLDCIHCCADAKKSKKEYMLQEEFYRLIDAISKLHVSQVTITGGEPMVCPGFLELP
ncbi:MAG: radical SAM protein, partial [Lachnospiraceae bacterium]|nr:radical SAM protein [Lachnospiraceae bacterium]